MTSVRDIWNSLEEKYIDKKEEADKFIIFKFFEFELDSNVIVESRDVDFFKNKFHHDSTRTNENVTQIPQVISSPYLNSFNKRNMAESSHALKRSERTKKERNLDLDFIDSQAIIFLVKGDNKNNVINIIPVILNVEDAPKTYKEVITSKNSSFWMVEIDDKIDSLISNNTWELSNLSLGSKTIGCRLVFRIKYHTYGSIQTFKARPDIAYVVCKLSRYMSNPSQDHWKAIRRVFGYFKRTRQLALYYDRFPTVLEGYSDASWITSSSDSKSTTGWIFTPGGKAVCWGLKKRICITHSTMKAEFLALAAAGKEVEWLRNMSGATPTKNSLEEKYTAEREVTDKFITFKFFEFAMEDNVSILDQVHEFLILVSKFKNLNIEIPEKLLVGAIITKLPSSWHNYRKKLMHTSDDFTLDQIQKHLRIGEETRIREKNLNGASSSKNPKKKNQNSNKKDESANVVE
nr:zinc finger, CCHC-type [Tanacetum cinerariifolium]